MFKARLARFYGWTDREIGRLQHSVALSYFESIELLKAEETLVSLNVSGYPHAKKAFRQKFEKSLKATIRRFSRKKGKPQSTEDLYHHMLRTLGNG